jgi:hypothetical protein
VRLCPATVRSLCFITAGGLTSLSALMIRNLSVKGKKLSAGAA